MKITEIKFRAYNKKNNHIESVYSIGFNSNNVIAYIKTSSGEYGNKDIELMQFTGIIDRKGKEIYEGHIVSMHQFLFDGNEIESEIVGVIVCNEYGPALTQIKNEFFQEYTGYDLHEGECQLSDIYGLHDESWKILGNKFENPELLKTKE